MPIPLAIPLVMAGVAAAGKVASALSQKSPEDYQKEVKRHDFQPTDTSYLEGRTGLYRRYDPNTLQTYEMIDRGSNADTFNALVDPNSSAAMDFNLGGSPEVAGQLVRDYGIRAQQAMGTRGAVIDYSNDDDTAALQGGLGEAYRAQFAGNAPSLAAIQSGAAQQENTRNLALARSMGSAGQQRAAIMGGAAMGANLAAQGAGSRMVETMQAGQRAGNLQNQMGQFALDRALAQTKLDSHMADFGDSLAGRYFSLAQDVADTQTKAQRQRGLALQKADQGRKDEVYNEASGRAERHNRDINMGIGAGTAGLSAAGSSIQGGPKK